MPSLLAGSFDRFEVSPTTANRGTKLRKYHTSRRSQISSSFPVPSQLNFPNVCNTLQYVSRHSLRCPFGGGRRGGIRSEVARAVNHGSVPKGLRQNSRDHSIVRSRVRYPSRADASRCLNGVTRIILSTTQRNKIQLFFGTRAMMTFTG